MKATHDELIWSKTKLKQYKNNDRNTQFWKKYRRFQCFMTQCSNLTLSRSHDCHQLLTPPHVTCPLPVLTSMWVNKNRNRCNFFLFYTQYKYKENTHNYHQIIMIICWTYCVYMNSYYLNSYTVQLGAVRNVRNVCFTHRITSSNMRNKLQFQFISL